MKDVAMIRAVIFDLDGTLASFNIDYKAVRADVRNLLIKRDLPASLFSINESIFEMLKKTEIFMKNNGNPEKMMEDIREKALATAEKYELEAAKTTSLLPGVPETLKALKKMSLKIGLCTINSEKSANYILKRFKIAEFFDAVTPRNSVRQVKPNTEHLEATLKALEAKPEESMVVGDGVSDIKCARELQAIAVGLPIGVSSPKELINAGANYLITSVTDLPMLVEYINKASKA
ncbi:MAG TPA: HAD family hydrolase [Acidobacteriota bacterium]|nr:HAD family hydrolase [Acidobacteriota bacterium]